MARFDNIRTQADVASGLNSLDAERVRIHRLRLQTDTQATGNIESASTPANGETLTIDDNEGNVVVFEFTDGGGATGSNTEVDKSATTDGGLSELKTALDASALNITSGTVTGGGPWNLPLTHDTNGEVGNDATLATTAGSLTLTQLSGGREGNLTAAATTQVVTLPALPANALVVAASIDLVEEFAGGGVSAATLDVGDSVDPDAFIAAEDVFTGAGTGQKQASPGVGFNGSTSGLPYYPAGDTPEVLVTTTTANVQDLQTGIADIVLVSVSPPATE